MKAKEQREKKIKSISPGIKAVYGVYDKNLKLVYIGKTECLRKRMSTHFLGRTSHVSFRFTGNHTFNTLFISENFDEVSEKETELIRSLKPIHNIVHNVDVITRRSIGCTKMISDEKDSFSETQKEDIIEAFKKSISELRG